MYLRKWNYQTRTYELYKIPDEWKCVTYCEDMKEKVNCPHCGKIIEYGNSYTSKEIHTGIGFGYAVCEKCYKKEWERKRKSEYGKKD